MRRAGDLPALWSSRAPRSNRRLDSASSTRMTPELYPLAESCQFGEAKKYGRSSGNSFNYEEMSEHSDCNGFKYL